MIIDSGIFKIIIELLKHENDKIQTKAGSALGNFLYNDHQSIKTYIIPLLDFNVLKNLIVKSYEGKLGSVPLWMLCNIIGMDDSVINIKFIESHGLSTVLNIISSLNSDGALWKESGTILFTLIYYSNLYIRIKLITNFNIIAILIHMLKQNKDRLRLIIECGILVKIILQDYDKYDKNTEDPRMTFKNKGGIAIVEEFLTRPNLQLYSIASLILKIGFTDDTNN